MTRLSAHWDKPVVLVPTMGALHAGHLALVRRARTLARRSGMVVVSIFVNPFQFGPKEDLSRYPRPLARDLRLCREAGVDLVFQPQPEDMYAPDRSVFVDEDKLSLGLCGAARPGHFRGVCTVVAKLLNLVRPDTAIFGQKDAQQLALIRRLVRDLNIPVRVVAAPTHREADGLAMSSRNAYLSFEERSEALALRRAILMGAGAIRGGERKAAKVREHMRVAFEAGTQLGRIDYLEVVDANTLAPLDVIRGDVLLPGAAFFGRTRLIDNESLRVPRGA